MKEYNIYPILENIRSSQNISESFFEQMLVSYGLSLKDFENGKENQIEFSTLIVNKLFKKKDRNFHTIASKDNFVNLTNDEEDVPFLMYTPLNEHSRPYLGIGDVLFSYRTGQFGDLDAALNTRGIYGLGIAMSNPMKFKNDHQGRDEYKDYGVIVFYPFKLKKHLSVRDIQLNPNTINLTPYNGNRNDSLQYIQSEEHYNCLLGMILYKNPHIKDFLRFMDIHIEENIIPDVLWGNHKVRENNENVNFDFKLAFKAWLKNKPEVGPKTQSNYISSMTSLENTWNKYNNKIDIWGNPYFLKNHIGKERLFSDPNIRKLNESQNRTHSSAINYYFDFLEYLKMSPLKGINRIYFGAPGTGKSYNIEKFIIANGIADYSDKIDCPNVFRATFHPEFNYTDFVGQIMPVVTPIDENGNNTKIDYKFSPQVFTKALKFAFEHSNEPVFLILEEMSRSNVAAAFGDIFQLLDRDENGESEYRIDNPLISTEIWGKNSIKKIYLPNNFFIIGTVNTSDQNVFVMDTAFKRRFEFEYVDTDPKAGLNKFNIKVNNKIIDWNTFYPVLNDFIINKLELTEDKQIGQFFIKFIENDEEYNNNQISNKLLQYLWNDVHLIKMTSYSLFKNDIKSFGMLYKQCKANGFSSLFSSEFSANFVEISRESIVISNKENNLED